jgi:hypothetical protein
VTVGVVAGGLAGGIFGAIVGAERWESVPLPARAAVRAWRRGAGVSLSLAF